MPFLRTSLITTVVLALAAVAAADAPEDLPRLRQYTQGTQPVFRFAIIDGRVALKSRIPSNFQTTSNFGDGQKESMSVRSDQGQPVLNYERTSAREHIKIEVAGSSGKVRISRSPLRSAKFVPMEFQQAPGEKTTLTLGGGERRQVLGAPDLWRLAIYHQKECGEHLFPLLEKLRPEWKVAALAARVETSLLARANEDTKAGDVRWAALVKQLGDDQFAKREAADRALRAGGPSALSYLRQIDFNRLDAEQQFRLRRILRAASRRNDDDLADEVAAPLARDRLVWLALLERPEAATRQIAARQLANLLGHAIDVDPAADPESQKAKRENLRAQLDKK